MRAPAPRISEEEPPSEEGLFWRHLRLVAVAHVLFVFALFVVGQFSPKAVPVQILWLDSGGSLGAGGAMAAEPEDAPTPTVDDVPEPEPEPVEPTPAVPPPLPEVIPPAPSEIVEPKPTPPPATPKPATPKPATPKQTTPKPATPKPATPKPATPKPATPPPKPKPTTPKPVTPKAATPKPKATEVASAKMDASPAPKASSSPKSAASPAPKATEGQTAGTTKGTAVGKTGTAGGGGGGSDPGNGKGTGKGRGSGSGGAAEFGWYFEMLHDRFYSRWEQPVGLGQEAATTVKLRILQDGTIASREMVKSSGSPQMDESVMSAAQKVLQIDPLPAGLGTGDHFDVNVAFKVGE